MSNAWWVQGEGQFANFLRYGWDVLGKHLTVSELEETPLRDVSDLEGDVELMTVEGTAWGGVPCKWGSDDLSFPTGLELLGYLRGVSLQGYDGASVDDRYFMTLRVKQGEARVRFAAKTDKPSFEYDPCFRGTFFGKVDSHKI